MQLLLITQPVAEYQFYLFLLGFLLLVISVK